jgi:hypothetical protein
MFIFISIIIALALAIVSESFSIIGMAATFPSIFWSVVAMGTVLGAGKLASASFLYRYWSYAPKLLTIPMTIFVIVLTMITITGHFGYLSKGYQQDSIALKQVSVRIEQLDDERLRKIERKHEIDTQIAQLPSDRVASRVKLAKQFEKEQNEVTTRINQLDEQITELKSKQIDAQAHIGPIMYISQALGISTDEGVKWFILFIVSVFDPLTLALTIAVSVMIQHRKEQLLEETKENEEKNRARRKRIQKEKDIPLDLFELVEDDEPEQEQTTTNPFSYTVKHPFKG